jgi:hypothetical protein
MTELGARSRGPRPTGLLLALPALALVVNARYPVVRFASPAANAAAGVLIPTLAAAALRAGWRAWPGRWPVRAALLAALGPLVLLGALGACVAATEGTHVTQVLATPLGHVVVLESPGPAFSSFDTAIFQEASLPVPGIVRARRLWSRSRAAGVRVALVGAGRVRVDVPAYPTAPGALPAAPPESTVLTLRPL